jgi:hypothetical protein
MSETKTNANELKKIIEQLTKERDTWINTAHVLEQTISVLKETNDFLEKEAREAKNWAKKLEKSNAELTQRNIELLKMDIETSLNDLLPGDLELILQKPKETIKTVDQMSDYELNRLIEQNRRKGF